MQIVSSRLAVEISAPGTLYRGARFDWTGFVTQVTLDQQHTFCAPEALAGGRGTGGVGLCNEFGIRQPLGYDEAAPGAQFPKLGVGLLTRPDERAYMFMRPYAVVPFPISIASEPDAVSFVVEPLPCAGYAARLHKRLSVVDATLTIDYRLENVGSRPISTTEYTHNFVCIDQHWPGPAYRLRLVNADVPTSLPAPLMIADGSIGWQSSPEQPYEWTLHAPQPAPNTWELVHMTSGVGLRETDSFGWQTFNLWGAAHVLSPESFLALQVAPGATAQWSRRYVFFGRRG